MTPPLFTAGLTLGLVALAWTAERSRLASWILVAGFVSAFGSGLLLGDVEMRTFTWVKVFTLLAAMVLLNLVRFSAWGGQNLWIASAMLALNILEAAFTDLAAGRWFNGVTGVVLCTLIPPPRVVRIRGAVPSLWFPTSRLWILAYTAWNFAFVIRFFPAHASDQVAVLLVPLLWIAHRPQHWVQVRTYTLSAYALLIVTWEEAFELPWAPTWFVPGDTVTTAAVALAMVLTALAVLRRRVGPSGEMT
ncbi:MAG: hypothetical protein AAF602_32050 [Myxococcota bacterium]